MESSNLYKRKESYEEENEENEENEINEEDESSSNNNSSKSSSNDDNKEEDEDDDSYDFDSEIYEENIYGTKIKEYKKGKFLGSGGFGKCYEIYSKENDTVYAGKIIPKKHELRIAREIKIQKHLFHKNILSLYKHFEYHNKIYILLEYCKNKTLETLFHKRKKLTELEVQCILVQLIEGLKYLRQNRVIHRDLKLSNIFLNDNLEILIGDFGLSKILEDDNEYSYTICGTTRYMAPEMILENGYSYEVDIWSLGIIMYILLFGKYPFDGRHKNEIYKKIKKTKYYFPKDTKISNEAKDLIKKILVSSPDRRPTLDEILKHDFFQIYETIPKCLPISSLNSPPDETYMSKYVKMKEKEDEQNDKTNLEVLVDPEIWIKKYKILDNTGVALLFNNNTYGAYFNDNTKMILDAKNNVFYYIATINNKDTYYKCKLDDFPKSIEEKAILLQKYKDILDEKEIDINKYCQCSDNKEDKEDKYENKIIDMTKIIDNNKNLIYVGHFKKAGIGEYFRLSNGYMQVSYHDKTLLLVNTKLNIGTYYDKSNNKYQDKLNNLYYCTSPEVFAKLYMFKKILLDFIDSDGKIRRKTLVKLFYPDENEKEDKNDDENINNENKKDEKYNEKEDNKKCEKEKMTEKDE